MAEHGTATTTPSFNNVANQQSSSSSQRQDPQLDGPNRKQGLIGGLKNQVNSFKARLQNQKKQQQGNPRDAMRAGEDPVRKKVLFGSMVETTGAEDSSHLMKNDRQLER